MKTRTILLFLLFAIFSKQAFSQTLNQSYELSGYNLNAGKVTQGYDKKSMFFIADVTDPSGTNPPTQLLVTKTDGLGNVIKSLVIDTALYKHKLIETSDSGILIAANPIVDDNPPFNSPLFIIKFDKNLNMQWVIKWGFPGFQAPLGNASAEVAIQKVPGVGGDIKKDEYIILYSSQSFASDPYATNDLCFSAIRVSQSGTVRWHHRYTDANRAHNPSTYVLDRINSITMLPDQADTTHTKNWFALSGSRLEGTGSGFDTTKIFSMIINDLGNIVVNYRKFNTVGQNAAYPKVMWDAVHTRLVYAYGEDISSVYPMAPSTYMSMGLLRTDAFQNPFDNRYYFNSVSISKLPCSITQAPADQNYIIETYGDEWTGVGPLYFSEGLAKISSTSLNPVYYYRYNDLQNFVHDVPGFHRTDSKGFNYMIPTIDIDGTHPTYQIRLLKTTSLGHTCGDYKDTLDYTDFIPGFRDYEYTQVSDSFDNISLNVDSVSLNIYYCDSTNWNYYRIAGNSPLNEFSVSITPTLISNSGQQIKCSITSPQNTDIDVFIINAIGQVVYKKQQAINYGSNIITIDGGILPRGLNIVRVSNKGRVLNTTKIMVND